MMLFIDPIDLIVFVMIHFSDNISIFLGTFNLDNNKCFKNNKYDTCPSENRLCKCIRFTMQCKKPHGAYVLCSLQVLSFSQCRAITKRHSYR